MSTENITTDPSGVVVNQGAEASMNTALSGEVSEESKPMSPDDMRTRLEAATLEAANDYDGCATYYGKMALRYLDKHGITEGKDLMYDKIKEEASQEEYEQILQELSGFMVGWGENAARFAVSAPAVPNPAIMEISI